MKDIDFSNYKFRCHALGKIMVGVKPNLTEKQEEYLKDLQEKKEIGKITDKQLISLGSLLEKKHAKPTLSKSVQSYLKELHQNIVFGRSKDITSKYLDKGIQAEEKSLSLLSSVDGSWIQKNKERFHNDFISGEPDIIQNNKVIDIKSSWNFQTFPMYETEVPNKDYYWQLQGYMDLTGLKEAELVYSLVDTPYKIVDDELRRMDWKFDILTLGGEVRSECVGLVKEMVSNHIYSEKGKLEYLNHNATLKKEWFNDFEPIPEDNRVKKFEIKRDENALKSLYSQIELCRAYMSNLTKELINNLKVNL